MRPTRCPFDSEPHKHLRSLSPPKYRNEPIFFFTPEVADLINRVGGVEVIGVGMMCVEIIGVGMDFEERGTVVTVGTVGGVRGVVMNLEEVGLEEVVGAGMGVEVW